MLIGSIPTKIPVPFGNAAVPPFIRPVPTPSQIGIQTGAASFTDGFPPANFAAIAAGGVPPFGEDMNGLLNQMTTWLRWVQAGAPIAYDASFQTDVGGYPLGAFVASAVTPGLYFVSTVDGNATNPDASGAGWTPVALGSGGVLSTGAWTWRPTAEIIPGWTKANATTIGDASSGASQLADATAFSQFSWLWTNFSNTQCPVSTGRGANPTADFAAHKTIQVLDMRGIAPIGMDTMGGAPTTKLAGVPVTSGSATQAGSILGEVLHAIIIAELALHNHSISDGGHDHGLNDPGHFHTAFALQLTSGTIFGTSAGVGAFQNIINTSTVGTGISIALHGTGIGINNTGSGTPHNNTGLSMAGTHYFKL